MSTFVERDAAGNNKYFEVVGQGTKEDPFVKVFDQSSKRTPMYQYADTVGDGSGSTNQAVDGSITPVSFKVVPPAGVSYGIARVVFSLRDTGTMDSGGWGNNGGNPLANGMKFIWHKNGVDIDLTPESITSHYILAGVCYDLDHNNWGAGDEYITARFSFTKAGQYLTFNGDEGDYLEVLVRDNLTGLVDQRLSAQGYQTIN